LELNIGKYIKRVTHNCLKNYLPNFAEVDLKKSANQNLKSLDQLYLRDLRENYFKSLYSKRNQFLKMFNNYLDLVSVKVKVVPIP
jgi:hypothetical protein